VPAGFELRPQILGICFYEDGDDEAARSELEAFLADGRLPAGDHRVVLARVYLAMALGRLGERDRAEAELRAARGEIRTNPNARWQTLAALGRSEKLLAD
jgi:hypothetical protein